MCFCEWCPICSGGGGTGSGGGDDVGAIVGRDDLPREIRGHCSLKVLMGHIMDLGLCSREQGDPVVLEAKCTIFSMIFLVIM